MPPRKAAAAAAAPAADASADTQSTGRPRRAAAAAAADVLKRKASDVEEAAAAAPAAPARAKRGKAAADPSPPPAPAPAAAPAADEPKGRARRGAAAKDKADDAPAAPSDPPKGRGGRRAAKADSGDDDKAKAADASKADASKADAAKADASKADAAKADASKADASKADASKAGAPKADAPKGRGKRAAVKDDSDGEDAPVKTADAPKGRGGKRAKAEPAPAAAAAPAADSDDDVAASPSKVVKKVMHVSGRAPVDDECPWAGKARVYESGDDVWDCALNQTDVTYGIKGHNKFYIIQLLESTQGNQFAVWTRWGRVGATGQSALAPMSSLDAAKATFSKKFYDKTRNHWASRASFKFVPGQYDLVHRDYSADNEAEVRAGASSDVSAAAAAPPPPSKLPSSVQRFVELIFNVRAMEEAMLEMEYDTAKAPLGKLTKQQVKSGYDALKAIEELVKAGTTSGPALAAACNTFYTRIPHNFGMRKPPLINSLELVQKKVKLLEALGEIEIAMTALTSTAKEAGNPIDSKYETLHCDVKPVDRSSDAWELVQKYLRNTHAATHASYALEMEDLFEVTRDGEADRFVGDTIGNHQLLWHGSRTTNYAGILSQGLRIAPPEAPSTGYMFGKGVYFADMVSKSANYCFTNPSNNTGCLLLCEVALGTPNELKQASFNASQLPSGKHSTKGLGRTAPDPAQASSIDGGKVTVPLGAGVPTNIDNTSLLYNEYIVYDIKQIRIRYLLRVKFNYGGRR